MIQVHTTQVCIWGDGLQDHVELSRAILDEYEALLCYGALHSAVGTVCCVRVK